MEQREKTSPVPGTNIFDPATLLGASPFSPGLSALPFAHLAHLPSAFSMLGHPAFPVTSLFGHLGDGLTSPLGIPTSLASSLSPTSGPSLSFDSILSPLLLTMGQSGRRSDPLSLVPSPSPDADFSKFGGLFSSTSSPSKYTSSLSTSTSTATESSPSTSKHSPNSSRRSGTGSRGRPRKLSKQPAIPLSLVQASSILSPSMLEKYAKKRHSNGTNGLDSDAHSDKSSASSLFDLSLEKDSSKDKKLSSPSPKSTSSTRGSSTSPSRRSPLKSPSAVDPGADTTLNCQLSGQDKVHIDSLKKKIIADQIRQRMLDKADSPQPNEVGISGSPPLKKRGRGRPPKLNDVSPTKDLENQKRREERLKRELELELRQQQIALKMLKKSNNVNNNRAGPSLGDNRRSKDKVRSPDKETGLLNLSKHKSTVDMEKQKSDDNKKATEEVLDMSTPLFANFNKTNNLSQVSSENVSSMDESNDQDSASSSGSESEADNQESEHDEGKELSAGKRKAEAQQSQERPVKRRHVVLDDSKIKIALEKGWKRQTNIHTYGRRGIVGEVWYFAPCGRKMKTIPDVMRYLERNGVTGLGRDNFSFNTKVNVGEFYEARVTGGENGFVKLTDEEIKDRLSVTVSRRMKKIENQKKREKLKMQQIVARQMLENKMKVKMEQQEMARKVAELQFQKRLQREQQREMLKRAKQLKLMEKRKQKDQLRLMREQERLQREEQQRIKREMRAHQIMETNLLWCQLEQERELKRQQAAMLKEQMRIKQDQERRRQHMLLLKALEHRKKQEDKERQRVERIAEKRLCKERKVEQRKMEFVLAQELKKPREDMELRDSRPMPDLPRIPGNVLDGDAFADCLMSLEFLHNFEKALGFDKDTLPTLKSLQDSVLCKTEEDGEEYMSLVTHLLRYALDDPGIANPKEAVTKLNQKITDMELTDAILSEVLRVFMVARNGGETELSEYLRSYPLEACTISQRAAVIAFLCNELNCSKNITSEIESHLDKMADIRRDKWVIEGKLRRLRTLRAKKFHHATPKPVTEGEGDDSMMTTISKQNSDDEEEKEEGSGNEEESFTDGDAEDDPTTLEECEKQIEKLQKQHAQHRDKVFDTSHHVRAIDLGQDRYKRNFWVLPYAGGIYVEGMESGAPKELIRVKVKNEKVESKGIKIEVIEERTEKKGVTLLEEMEEKKGLDLLNETAGKKVVKNEKKVVKVEPSDGEKSERSEIKEEVEKKCEVKQEPVSEMEKSVNKEVEKCDESEKREENSVGEVRSEHCDSKPVKEELVNGELEKHIEMSEEPSKKVVNGELSCDTVSEQPQRKSVSGTQDIQKSPSKLVELKIPNINKSSAIEVDKSDRPQSNSILQVPGSTKLSDVCSLSINSAINSDKIENPVQVSSDSSLLINTSSSLHQTQSANCLTSLPSPPRPPPAHTQGKHDTSRKPSFMSIDSILEKKSGSSHQNSASFTSSALPVNPFTVQHRPSEGSHVSDNKPWFSILPRVPCDDMSLTRGQHSSISSGMLYSPPFLSQIPFHPISLQQSPSFASFQRSQLFGSTSSLDSLTSSASATVTSLSHGSNSFKKPEAPASQTPDPEEVLKSLQGEAKPIPKEMQGGWWKIATEDQLCQLQKCFHPRGIREKNLSKTLQKFNDCVVSSLTKAKKEVICMESSSDEESEEEEEEEEEEDQAEEEETKTKEESEKQEEEKEKESADTKDEKEKESLSDKEKSKADEKEKSEDDPVEETGKVKKVKKAKPAPEIDVKAKADEADRLVLEEVETLEDRVAAASLQIKGWKLAPKTYSDESEVRIITRGDPKKDENDMYPVEAAKERLLQLELNIERRYLKPPLSKAQKINLTNLSSSHNESTEDIDNDVDFENLPVGLQTWRIAVATATSPAQLMLCIIQLNTAISWEKSIMKVLCQICRKDDNEAELLLCDGCDRGYHTYCFRPKMETVPAGDWYCYECVAKAAGEMCCLICGNKIGRMAECNMCNRSVHLDCLNPPLPRVPRKWYCASCEDQVKGPNKKRVRKSSTASSCSAQSTPVVQPQQQPQQQQQQSKDQDTTPSGRKRRSDFGQPRKRKSSENPSESDASPQKKEGSPADKQAQKLDKQAEKERLKQGEQSSDTRVCRSMLTEMMKHEDAWPFLQPVNCKHFPSYRKYIKSPMDLGTMKIKLRDHVYTKRIEFVTDAHLVFDNCKLFNEDDSEVGQCGHNMKKFFVKRWHELLLESLEDNS